MELTKMYACHVCGSKEFLDKLIVKEMLLGIRNSFEYFLCSNCGCLQINSIPYDIEDYYKSDNYSPHQIIRKNNIIEFLKRERFRYEFNKEGILGFFLSYFFPTGLPPIGRLLKIKRNMSIIDIGCGAGYMLEQLFKIGFNNIIGIDKYIASTHINIDGIKIIKGEIKDVKGTYDIIIMNHSFEHIENQHEFLESIKMIVAPGGIIMIRMPIIGEAFRLYKENWFQIDAPRHTLIHSKYSFKHLTKIHGFKIDQTVFDSGEAQFTNSIRYAKNISSKERHPFTKKELKYYRLLAKELNLRHEGDSACFILSLG
jgi:SAM-dependent methyltransferase